MLFVELLRLGGAAVSAKHAAIKKATEYNLSFLESQARAKATDLAARASRKSDAEIQHEHTTARQSILGGFWFDPTNSCVSCNRDAKAVRRRQRLALCGRARLVCFDKAGSEAATRLRGDMDEVENMRCAKQVYLDNDPSAPAALRDHPPPGFTRATEEQLVEMGLRKNMLVPDRSHFRAAVYMKDPMVWGENPRPPAVLAFRGSTTALEDWRNNFMQGANEESAYYERAVNIGNLLAFNKVNLHIVGHSLGGGLASAAQGGSGLSASTYNAAGLHSKTVARYSTDKRHMAAEPDKIHAIRIEGEVLTQSQESLWSSRGASLLAPAAVGRKRDLAPARNQQYFEQHAKFEDTDDYATYLHGMDEVIAAMEQQKSEDERTINKCLDERIMRGGCLT